MIDKLLTTKQVSELLQVALCTVYLWTHTEFIPHFKLGKAVRFREKDVLDWLEKRRIEGRPSLKYK